MMATENDIISMPDTSERDLSTVIQLRLSLNPSIIIIIVFRICYA